MIKLDYSLPPITALKKGLAELSKGELKLNDINIIGVEVKEDVVEASVQFGPYDDNEKWKGEITRQYLRVNFLDIVELHPEGVIRGPFLTLTTNMIALSEAIQTGYGVSIPPEKLVVGETDYVGGLIEVQVKGAETIYGSAYLSFIEHKIDLTEAIEYNDVAMFEV